MSVVIDASALVPLVLIEAESAAARAFVATAPSLVAPDLVAGEFANAIWKAVRLQRIAAPDAAASYREGLRLIGRLVPVTALVPRALELALARNHPVYDCIYVALAERERMPLVTCDRRLAAVFATVIALHLLDAAGPAPPPQPRRPARRR